MCSLLVLCLPLHGLRPALSGPHDSDTDWESLGMELGARAATLGGSCTGSKAAAQATASGLGDNKPGPRAPQSRSRGNLRLGFCRPGHVRLTALGRAERITIQASVLLELSFVFSFSAT